MYTDKENTFAERVPVTAAGVIGDVLFVSSRQTKSRLWAYLQPEVPFDNLTSIRFRFVSSALPDLSNPHIMYDSGDITLANFSGVRLVRNLPFVRFDHNYIGWIVPAGGIVGVAPANGAVTAGLAETVQLESLPRPAYWTGLAPAQDGGAPVGFIFLADNDDTILTDDDGANLLEAV